MPVTSKINSQLHLLEHTCRGILKVKDFVDAFDAAMRLPGFERSMPVLWDVRDASVNAPPDQLQALVTHVSLSREQRGTDYRLAVVAEDAVLFLLADIFKALSSPLSFQVKVFHDVDEARNWIYSPH